jgi:hypothetical protein
MGRNMKIIKKIVIPAQIEKTIEKEIYVCDVCKKETRNFKQCAICERLMCYDISGKCFYSDPHCSGDYPDYYCPICYKLRFEIYEKEINQIQLDAEKKEELIIQKIKEESLKHI